MSIDTIKFNPRQIGGGNAVDSVSGLNLPIRFNSGFLPSRIRSLSYGTGANQVNKIYFAKRTLAATTFDLLDLAGGLTDPTGATITMTALKLAYIALMTQDGTNALRIGPQAQANAGAFMWGGTGATVYHTTYSDWEDYRPITGWTVTAGTGDIFPIYNPGATSVDYAILLLGTG